MKHLREYENSPLKSADTIIAGFRIYLGFVLIWKAIEFFFNQSVFINYFVEVGEFWFTPVAWLHFVFLTHIFGGICLLFGIGTRVASIMQLPVLCAAVFLVHIPAIFSKTIQFSFAEVSLAIFTLILLLFFSIRGSGTYSIDYISIYEVEHKNSEEYHSHSNHHV